MVASKECIEAIKSFEGLRLKAYQCPSGVTTIGYGHTSSARLNSACSQIEAEKWLREDLERVYAVLRKVRVYWTQGMWDACTSFVFNVGGQQFLKSSLKKKMEFNAEDPAIKKEFMKWVYSKGRVLNGLKSRRQWEAKRYYQ